MIRTQRTPLVAAICLATTAVVLLADTFAFGHGEKHNPSRHQYMMQNGIPADYKQRTNPLQATSENLAGGKVIYGDNCVACHGTSGKSNTEAAKEMKPRPAVLAGMYDKTMAGMNSPGPQGHMMHGMMHHHPGISHAEAMGGLNLDAYNFWAVSEGGEPVGSAMPSFADILSEKERWQVLLYIANDFNVRKGA